MKNVMSIFGVLAGLIFSTVANAQPILLRAERYLPNFTGTVASLDINRDGITDILVVPANGLGPVAYMGRNGISFADESSRTIAVGPLHCEQLVAAEVTGDLFTDLLCASNDLNAVLLITNNNGVLAPPVVLSSATALPQFAVADLDGDGDKDIAIVDGVSPGVTTLTNSGSGSFSASMPITFRTPPRSIKAADLDSDGVPDLVLIENAQLKVYYARPNNRFLPARFVPQPATFLVTFELADIDSDGDIDIATSGFLGLRSLRNDGLHQFTLVGPTTAVPPYTTDLTFGDFNRDGKSDFIASAGSYGGMQMYLQTANPFSFVNVTGQWLRNLSRMEISRTQLADLDGDSIPEILALAGSGDGIEEGTVLAKGAGNYYVDLVGAQGAGMEIYSQHDRLSGDPCIVDYDNDGFLDLVSAGSVGAEGIFLMRGDGMGHFSAPQILVPLQYMGPTASCASGDFNHDGRTDFVFAAGRNTQSSSDYLFYRNSSGGLDNMSHLISSLNTWSLAVNVADLNADGYLDIIFAGFDETVSNRFSTRILFGNAAGFTNTLFPSVVNDAYTHVAVGDIDTDGDLDVFISGEDSTRVLENQGGGNFSLIFTPHASGATSAIITDFDQDGFKDLFITTVALNQTNLLFNGSPNGLIPGTMPDSFQGTSSTLIDLNGDAVLDLVVGDAIGNYAAAPARVAGAYLNLGLAGLIPVTLPPVFSGGMDRVLAADFDSDGDQDLLAYETTSSLRPHIYFNTTRHLSLTNQGRLGQNWQLEIAATDPNLVVHIWASIDPVGPGINTPFGRFRLVNPGFTGTFVVPSGGSTISIPIPALSGIDRLSFQAAIQDSSGQIRFSNVASLGIE